NLVVYMASKIEYYVKLLKKKQASMAEVGNSGRIEAEWYQFGNKGTPENQGVSLFKMAPQNVAHYFGHWTKEAESIVKKLMWMGGAAVLWLYTEAPIGSDFGAI
ncbi:hypothetical protein ACJX0J_027616, partial [Zea mays]